MAMSVVLRFALDIPGFIRTRVTVKGPGSTGKCSLQRILPRSQVYNRMHRPKIVSGFLKVFWEPYLKIELSRQSVDIVTRYTQPTEHSVI